MKGDVVFLVLASGYDFGTPILAFRDINAANQFASACNEYHKSCPFLVDVLPDIDEQWTQFMQILDGWKAEHPAHPNAIDEAHCHYYVIPIEVVDNK